jgi:hypothetical protein
LRKTAAAPPPRAVSDDLRDVIKGLSIGTGVSIAGYQTNRMLDQKREERDMQRFNELMKATTKKQNPTNNLNTSDKYLKKPENAMDVFTGDDYS